jgi:hypothetical protein
MGPDRLAPLRITVTAPKLSSLLSRGLSIKVTCSQACRTTVVATVDKATAKKLKLGKKLELGRGTSARPTVTVKLNAKARKALRKARSLKLRLTITSVGADGTPVTARKTVTVKR